MPKGVMTVSDMEYEPGDHTTFIIAEGPAKKQPGQYVLCVEHNERKVFHAYGEPSNQKGRGVVTDIEIVARFLYSESRLELKQVIR